MSSDNSVEVIGSDIQITSPDISRIFVSETDPAEEGTTLNDGQDLWVEAAGDGSTGGGGSGSGGSGGSVEQQLEAAMHTATNDYRESQGLSPYGYRDDVAAVARSHSQNMYEQDNLAHYLDGQDMGDRLNEAGISYSSAGENIAYQTHDSVEGGLTQSEMDSIAQSFIDSWVESTGHRENIESDMESEGIGVYIDSNENVVWATAVFITP